LEDAKGFARFGLMSNQVWNDDPKRLAFLLSRYKFVAKMLEGREHVLEVGCADAFGTRIVRREVGHLTAVDFDPVFIDDAKQQLDPDWPIDFQVHDLLDGPLDGSFDGAFMLDVLEHINPEHEGTFLRNLSDSMVPGAAVIVGVPSIQSQDYASPASREGHVNCKDGPGLKEVMSEYFENVFIFSMNDEVVHTGFAPMAHYLLALACGKKA
jgi:2-polyprenyl-3-methyl-5-hydroxy-6-metoxy-1,4-benzoquinol methylase